MRPGTTPCPLRGLCRDYNPDKCFTVCGFNRIREHFKRFWLREMEECFKPKDVKKIAEKNELTAEIKTLNSLLLDLYCLADESDCQACRSILTRINLYLVGDVEGARL